MITTIKRQLLILLLFTGICNTLLAQQDYPYPVHYINLAVEKQVVKMAYMYATPTAPYINTIMLFHGKNFNGYYWKDVAAHLVSLGYRVIIPDQLGWGRSDKPDIHYSFHALAANNKALLDSLHIDHVIILGHSMGGMLASRFALMYPAMVSKLILEDPIGLEDYRTFVPYTPLAKLYQSELAATYDSYKKYMQSYFPQWRPEYEELVNQQAAALHDPAFTQIAWANALTYQMIYEQPVCYEFKELRMPTLLITGQADRTIVGKDKVPEELLPLHGQYPQLGKAFHAQVTNSRLAQLPGIGHIPHIQQLSSFTKEVDDFCSRNKTLNVYK